MEKNGYMVIPNILSSDECKIYQEQIWDELKYVSNNEFDYYNESTWPNYELFNPKYSMLLHQNSLGHMQAIWNLRQHPSIYGVFEKLYNVSVDELLVSFDGLAILLPPEKTNKQFIENDNFEWFHTDQSSKKLDRHCIQSMITLYDIEEGDSTLNVLEGSHLYHQSFFADNNIVNNSDWYLLKDNEKDYFLNKNCTNKKIVAKAGSLILWDSRLIHQAIKPSITRPNQNTRMVIYICMMPRSTITFNNKKILKLKQKAFNKLRITNHWANSVFLFPKQINNNLNSIHQPILNNIGKRLAGFD